MRKVITGVGWWLVLTSPVVGWGLYTWITQPHLHPSTGPHRGILVEWDVSHSTVAEAVLDPRSGVVTVYILDRWATRPRPIKVRSITLTLANGRQSVIEMMATPTRLDPDGWSSRFSSGRVLEPGAGSGLAGTLSVVANGRQYTGNFRTNEDRR